MRPAAPSGDPPDLMHSHPRDYLPYVDTVREHGGGKPAVDDQACRNQLAEARVDEAGGSRLQERALRQLATETREARNLGLEGEGTMVSGSVMSRALGRQTPA